MTTFRDELHAAINRHSKENGSDTPDFLLAEFLEGCLIVFDRVMQARTRWYGHAPAEPAPVELSSPVVTEEP